MVVASVGSSLQTHPGLSRGNRCAPLKQRLSWECCHGAAGEERGRGHHEGQ